MNNRIAHAIRKVVYGDMAQRQPIKKKFARYERIKDRIFGFGTVKNDPQSLRAIYQDLKKTIKKARSDGKPFTTKQILVMRRGNG